MKKTNVDILSKSENEKSNFEKLIYYKEREIKQLNRQIDNLKKEKEKIKKEYEDKIKKLKENDTSKNLNTINSSTTSNLNIFRNRRLNRKAKDDFKQEIRNAKINIGTQMYNRFMKGFESKGKSEEEKENQINTQFLFKKLQF